MNFILQMHLDTWDIIKLYVYQIDVDEMLCTFNLGPCDGNFI
jgi:hypothetical protein